MLSAKFFVLFTSAISAFNLQPPEDRWVKIGHETDLKCVATKSVESCSWSTPYGKDYPLKIGNRAEKGRLTRVSSSENDCNIVIENVEARDDGMWTCLVGFVDETGDVSSDRANATIRLATRPSGIQIKPVKSNFSIDTNMTINCTVDNARPAPKFAWFVGEIPIYNVDEGVEIGDNQWRHTLIYEPDVKHVNKSLRCVVDHLGFENGDVKKAETIIRFSPEDIIKVETASVSGDDNTAFYIFIVCAVLLVSGFCLFIIVAVVKKLCSKFANVEANCHVVNDEAKVETAPEEAAKDDVKGDEDADEKGDNINGRLSSIFGQKTAIESPGKNGFAGFVSKIFARRNIEKADPEAVEAVELESEDKKPNF